MWQKRKRREIKPVHSDNLASVDIAFVALIVADEVAENDSDDDEAPVERVSVRVSLRRRMISAELSEVVDDDEDDVIEAVESSFFVLTSI